jgi:hypothetical protein
LAGLGATALVVVSIVGLSAQQVMGVHGAAFGYSVGWVVAALASVAMVVRNREGWRAFAKEVLATAAASLGGVALASLVLLNSGDDRMVRLIGGASAFVVTAFLIGWVLNVRLVRELVRMVIRQGQRSRR